MNAVGTVQDVINLLTKNYKLTDKIYISNENIGNMKENKNTKMIQTTGFKYNLKEVPDLTIKEIMFKSDQLCCIIIPSNEIEKQQ